MVIKEMRMHMASPEACFQAETAESCFAELCRCTSTLNPFSSLLLRDAIENVCSESMSPDTQQRLAQLEPLNLFAIVSGTDA